jgi:hypothetical protein
MACDWQELRFGKYKGKTPPQIALCDPDWIFWANANLAPGPSSREIAIVADRARRILLPAVDGVPQVVQYVVNPMSGKFVAVEIFPCAEPNLRRYPRVLDLSYARRCHPYDKFGGRLLVQAVKKYVLGVSRITRDIADIFFIDDCNFAVWG